MKYGILISLLFLTGCNWISGGSGASNPVPEAIYTADWELDSYPPLSACDGMIPVNYHMTGCYKNGAATSLSECSGLIKLPAQVKSPSGNKDTDITNYVNEVIGKRTYNCTEGQIRQDTLSSVNCSDSRYIKQTKDEVSDCYAYFTQLKPYPVSSENKLYKLSSPGLRGEELEVVPLFNVDIKKSLFTESEYFYIQLSSNDELVKIGRTFWNPQVFANSYYDVNPQNKELKSSNNNSQCLIFIDDSFFCTRWSINIPESNPLSQSLLTQVKGFYKGIPSGDCWQNVDGKFYCDQGQKHYWGMGQESPVFPGYFMNDDFNTVTEITTLDGATQIFYKNENHYNTNWGYCFNKNNQGYCMNEVTGLVELVSNVPLIDVSGTYENEDTNLCIVNSLNQLFCKGPILSLFNREITSNLSLVMESVISVNINTTGNAFVNDIQIIKTDKTLIKTLTLENTVIKTIPIKRFDPADVFSPSANFSLFLSN